LASLGVIKASLLCTFEAVNAYEASQNIRAVFICRTKRSAGALGLVRNDEYAKGEEIFAAVAKIFWFR